MEFGAYYVGRFVQLIAVAINIVLTILLDPVVKNLGVVWDKRLWQKVEKNETEEENLQ